MYIYYYYDGVVSWRSLRIYFIKYVQKFVCNNFFLIRGRIIFVENTFRLLFLRSLELELFIERGSSAIPLMESGQLRYFIVSSTVMWTLRLRCPLISFHTAEQS